ncbi:MAG: insulinase family protein [Deltaproteobacteria bacterium]|nr:insulinase family protein [Deltaproteobacteria bacterium]TLN03347.1 MAG: insulinase family protein [bacterium]
MIRCSKKTLANGLRILAVQLPHLHSAEIAIYLKVGSRNDPPGKEGLSHFLEHMLFRGTADYATTLELETAFEVLGGSVNAATDADSTCFYTRIHPRHAVEGLAIFASMLLRPSLSGIEIEKRIITEEALEDTNENGEDINTDNLASKLLWPDHPLGMPTVGTLKSIAEFTDQDLAEHLHSYYVPTNAVITVTGDIDPDELFGAAERCFSSWQGPPPPAISPAPSVQNGPRSLFVKDMDSQTALQFAFRSFSRPDHRITASRLIRRILCAGGSSRLLMSLREGHGIAYSVSAGISAYDETGCFSIDLATAPENLTLAVAEVLKETQRLAVEPMDEEELERVKRNYFYDLEYCRDSTYEIGVRYGWGELMEVFTTLEQDQEESAAVTVEEIRNTACELFAPHHLNLVAVGPATAATKREIGKLLQRYEQEYPGRT